MTKEVYSPAVLRLILGPLFIVPGISKLLNPGMIIGMLGGMGFPGASFFGWLLLLSEIIFGLCVLLGWKVKYTVWPLVVVLLVATIMVHIPAMVGNPMGAITVLFHLLGIAALVSVFLTGAGALSIDSMMK
ncbi:DoxX family protein [Candidatus Woesearchaeota archaeon]|nr:DoxX family protein [Candidatus Woesearchaeota archaeon]